MYFLKKTITKNTLTVTTMSMIPLGKSGYTSERNLFFCVFLSWIRFNYQRNILCFFFKKKVEAITWLHALIDVFLKKLACILIWYDLFMVS